MSTKPTVVITNVSGQAVSFMGHRVKPLRETTADQAFSFTDESTADKFCNGINRLEIQGLKAIFAGSEIVDSEQDNLTELQKFEAEYKGLTAAKLKAKCKKFEIQNYNDLPEEDLIKLLMEYHKEQEEK